MDRLPCLNRWSLTFRKFKTFGKLLTLSLLLNGCFVMPEKFNGLPPGKWRAVLKIDPQFITPNPKGRPLPEKTEMKFADVTPGELPFNFEVIYDDDTTFHIEISNGSERILVPAKDIRFGRGKQRARDTLRIEFPHFESYITASFAGNMIDGQWVVTTRENYSIPFNAIHGKDYRFTPLRKSPAADLTGSWQTTIGLTDEKPEAAIGEFQQTGNHLTGTFRTETGDYRFLEGTVQGNKGWLSCFDGTHAYLFELKILDDNTLTGTYFSGKHYQTTWEAKRNAQAKLADPDSLTFLKPGFDKLTFAFENPDGKVISPENPEYQGKVKLVQIMGTWCPNCKDETEFLTQYLKDKNSPNLAVISLAFEKHTDKTKANHIIGTYKNRLGIPWEVVHAGMNKKDEASKALPALNQVLAFPTLIVLDKNNRVRRIHTGFSGPATSQYEDFKKEFDAFISQLLAETK